MLSEQKKTELRKMLGPGERVTGHLARLQVTREPEYRESCGFVLAQLDEIHGVPKGKRGRYLVQFDFTGSHIVFGGWGNRGYIQEVGTDLRHPAPFLGDLRVATPRAVGRV